jgi:hypothetical protein
VGSAQLKSANRNPIASFELAANSSTVRRTKVGLSTGNLELVRQKQNWPGSLTTHTNLPFRSLLYSIFCLPRASRKTSLTIALTCL